MERKTSQRVDKNNLKINYALFAYAGVTNHTAEWLAHTTYWCGQNGIKFTSLGADSSSSITQNRNKALGQFMAGSDDVLLMVDADMTWSHPFHLVELCAAATDLDAVVSVIASKKKIGGGIVGARGDGKPHDLSDDSFIEATAAGTGIMAIPRSVISRAESKAAEYLKECRSEVDINEFMGGVALIEQPDGLQYYDWFYQMRAYRLNKGWMNLGEDTSFCLRLRHWKERVYITNKYNIGHVGQYTYYPEDGVRDV